MNKNTPAFIPGRPFQPNLELLTLNKYLTPLHEKIIIYLFRILDSSTINEIANMDWGDYDGMTYEDWINLDWSQPGLTL
jgi:hypothetical protein